MNICKATNKLSQVITFIFNMNVNYKLFWESVALGIYFIMSVTAILKS